MRILHFSTSDSHGGAAKYAYKLHQLFRHHGHDSNMVVKSKLTDDRSVIEADFPPVLKSWHRFVKHLPIVGREKTKFTFNQDREAGVSLEKIFQRFANNVDIIFIHWVSEFLTTKRINQIARRFNVPLVMPALDQELTTGGCHYSFDCTRYENQCGECPLLLNSGPNDLSHRVWRRKKSFISPLDVTYVPATSWSEAKIQKSSLSAGKRVKLVPLPIDESIFIAQDRAQARRELGLDQDARIILFGASYLNEPRKGGKQFVEAMQHLAKLWSNVGHHLNEVQIAIIGQRGETYSELLPFRSKILGQQKSDQELARAYAAADVFACSSIYDAGPMMISESLMCGTPVVAFEMGSAPDIISAARHNGYIAKLANSEDFSRGIYNVLTFLESDIVRENCRTSAIERHGYQNVLSKYEELFRELVSS